MWNPKQLAEAAKKWAGKNFAPGQTEQCMAFVRHCANESACPVAKLVTKKAVDGLDSGYYLSSSLAGRDLGYELHSDIHRLSAGSIVFFNDTYDGPWPKGTITHVGIYIGSYQFAHRPTVARPVEIARLDSGYWHEVFRCALDLGRPTITGSIVKEEEKEDRLQRYKIFAHGDRLKVLHNQVEQQSAEVKIFANEGRISVVINGQTVELSAIELDVKYRAKKV
jgi:hypothetical protein